MDGEVTVEIARLKEEIKRLRKVLRDISPSLEALLRKRGLRIYKKEPSEDLLLPDPHYIDQYYQRLQKYSFRLFLRDVIKYQKGFSLEDVTRYATEEVTAQYISYLEEIGLIERSGKNRFFLKKPLRSFGETLEWFFAELLKREFFMEATWGVRFKDTEKRTFQDIGEITVGGDFDVIAKFNGSVLYVEVKSSPPKQIYQEEIKAFLKRIELLNPEISIFFMDTELRMKDKIVPMFEEEIGEGLERVEREIFHKDYHLYIMNSKESILHNIETILSWYHRHKRMAR